MTEEEVCAALHIPADADRVIMFSQSSHLDWDWRENFDTLCHDGTAPYFHHPGVTAPAFDIFDKAVSLVGANIPDYYYSVAEIAFLRAYAESSPERLAGLQNCGTFLHLCGGGMTSPDNLLPHGETFLRNSLVAKNWYSRALGLNVRNLWIPDDFGHDSQLPVLAAALDLIGAGFARVPGGWAQGQVPLDGSPSVAELLTEKGGDFVWAANDGSMIVGHWMPDTYGQGDDIDTGDPNANIDGYLAANAPSSKTRYVFVPVGGDFALPIEDLLADIQNYNSNASPSQAYAVLATFDHYIDCVAPYAGAPRSFNAVPYFLGFFASRPANKIVHYAATRALLAAEVLSVLAGIAGDVADRLQRAWDVLVPSTHHDYITGTSGTDYMDVNAYEQLPRLRLAEELGTRLRDDALSVLAHRIAPQVAEGTNYDVPVVVANPLGFARTGLVALPGGAAIGASALTDGSIVQANADGSLLFMASVPSFGYTTAYVATMTPADLVSNPATLTNSGTRWTLANALLSATIDSAAAWNLTSLTDLSSNADVLSANGNTLAFYQDRGDIYRYGNEGDYGFTALDPTQTAGTLEVLETGPLRVSVRVTTAISLDSGYRTFVRTYTLVAGEPFLRMSITGALPEDTSLFVSFPLATPVVSLTRGTTYHWDDATTVPYWALPIFYATHDWLLPIDASGTTLAAVYHDAIPSWGYDAAGHLLGNVLRNTWGANHYGAQARDTGTHTQHYALRVPSGLGAPASGQPLQEALQFTTPMLAATIPPLPLLAPSSLPDQGSLAAVSSLSNAILTVAKPADDAATDLILRVYQPTNNPEPITITTQFDATNATIQSALEAPFANREPGASITTATTGSLTINQERALTTIRLPNALL